MIERIQELKKQHERALARQGELSDSLAVTQSQYETVLTCQKLVQSMASAIQTEVHGKLIDIVNRCLRVVFGADAYTFKIDFEQKRGKTEAVLLFNRNGMDIDPLSASGGGVVDVASFGLRLASLVLTRNPRLRRLVVFDEPFRFVSRNHWPKLVQLIEKLGEELDVQFIIVTHCPELSCGTVVEVQ